MFVVRSALGQRLVPRRDRRLAESATIRRENSMK